MRLQSYFSKIKNTHCYECKVKLNRTYMHKNPFQRSETTYDVFLNFMTEAISKFLILAQIQILIEVIYSIIFQICSFIQYFIQINKNIKRILEWINIRTLEIIEECYIDASKQNGLNIIYESTGFSPRVIKQIKK